MNPNQNDKINPTTTLNNGLTIPMFCLGSGGGKDLDKLVYECIKSGLRMIDTAMFYQNEKEIGVGVNKAISEGLVERKDLYIITKIWYTHKHIPEVALTYQLKELNLI